MDYPYMPLETPVGQGSADEYSGDSMEDFYEYLITPRHQMERSGQGAITHYGPSRYASVNPEDAKMAEFLMKQMEAESELEYNKGLRESDLRRRSAADEMMMPQGQGGGSISFAGGGGEPSAETRFGRRGQGWEQGSPNAQTMPVGGGMPEGPPAGPPETLTEGQRSLLTGQESKIGYAEAQGSGYQQGPKPPSDSRQKEMAKLGYELDTIQSSVMEIAARQRGWEGLSFKEIVERAATKPDSIPPEFAMELGDWMNKGRQLKAYMGGGSGQPERKVWKPGG